MPSPWLHQDTTTLTLYGAYEAGEQTRTPPPHRPEHSRPPRPASGHSQAGQEALKQGLLSLGVSREGLPLRLGVRHGHTSDRTEPAVALEACVALGLAGGRGIVAARKAYGNRTLRWCLEQGVGLSTVVPRTCLVRQAREAWGQHPGMSPLWLAQPGRPRQEPPRRWQGHSVVRRGPVEAAAGRLAVAERRFVVVHSSQLAQQTAGA
jgi:hypothetical protein